jgi:hypothetical protein
LATGVAATARDFLPQDDGHVTGKTFHPDRKKSRIGLRDARLSLGVIPIANTQSGDER